MGNDGVLLDIERIRRRWNVPCNILLHLSFKKKLQQIITPENIYLSANPKMSYILHDIGIGNNGNKNTYFNINTDNTELIQEIRVKWATSFNEDIFMSTIQNSFKNADFQLRLINILINLN